MFKAISINRLVFETETQVVLCELETENVYIV